MWEYPTLQLMNGLERAISEVGGVCNLARKLDLHHSSIILWRKNGRVPAERVLAIEQATGVPREEIRPDIFSNHESTGVAA